MPTFFERIKGIVEGTVYGDVTPRREAIPVPAVDARTAALRALKAYFAELTFWRAGAEDCPPIGFCVDPKNIQVEVPDGKWVRVMPSIAFVAGPFEFQTLSQQPYERSRDQFGPGTVLIRKFCYVEQLQIEVVASVRAERRAMLAGIQVAMSPSDEFAGLRLTAKDFFGMPASFMLQRGTLQEEPNAARGRRIGRLATKMSIEVVQLYNYRTMKPFVRVNTDLDVDAPTAPFSVDPPGC